ncbi:hypothetical protein WAK64_15815 [Bacillus spongiae]|uniref:PH domain-containing protein n=1 Tax=Bacillus spongiae TaxID=2683610 RepID=A0ABU8HGK1_9BACI
MRSIDTYKPSKKLGLQFLCAAVLFLFLPLLYNFQGGELFLAVLTWGSSLFFFYIAFIVLGFEKVEMSAECLRVYRHIGSKPKSIIYFNEIVSFESSKNLGLNKYLLRTVSSRMIFLGYDESFALELEKRINEFLHLS